MGEIERQFGGAVPGGRDAIIRQFTNYRRRRGGALRGAARDQIVTEVTAMIRAETAQTDTGAAGGAVKDVWTRPAGEGRGGGGVGCSGAQCLLLCIRAARTLLNSLSAKQGLLTERLSQLYNAACACHPNLAGIRFHLFFIY